MGNIGWIGTHILIFDDCQQILMWCLIESKDKSLLATSGSIITPLTIVGIVEISWSGSRACRLCWTVILDGSSFMWAAGQVFDFNLYFLLLCENLCDESPGGGQVKGFWIRGLGENTTQHSDLKWESHIVRIVYNSMYLEKCASF